MASWISDREGSLGKVYKVRRDEFGKTYYSAVKMITIPQNEADLRQIHGEGMDDASLEDNRAVRIQMGYGVPYPAPDSAMAHAIESTQEMDMTVDTEIETDADPANNFVTEPIPELVVTNVNLTGMPAFSRTERLIWILSYELQYPVHSR